MDETTGVNLLRSFLMLASGVVTGTGYVTDNQWVAIVGGLVAVVTIIWDHVAHKTTVAKVGELTAAVKAAAPK